MWARASRPCWDPLSDQVKIFDRKGAQGSAKVAAKVAKKVRKKIILVCAVDNLQQWSNIYTLLEKIVPATPNSQVAGIALDRPADLSSKVIQASLSPSALLGFFRLADLWKLRDQDARGLLGGISNGTYYSLKRRPAKTLDQDKLTRISLLLGIFKALNILYSRKLADAWVQLPNRNPMFGGESPLASMIKGGVPAMIRVRQLVDARRGGR